jgi:hypothetical protein
MQRSRHRPRELPLGRQFAITAGPIAGAALINTGFAALRAFGPQVFDSWWLLVPMVLVGIATALLALASFPVVPSRPAATISFFLLLTGFSNLWFGMNDLAGAQRDKVTACVVTHDERTSRAQGNQYVNEYDYQLRCTVPQVTFMTSDTDVGRAGAHIDVLYDPTGRVRPSPVVHPRTATPLLTALLALAAALVLVTLGNLFGRKNR